MPHVGSAGPNLNFFTTIAWITGKFIHDPQRMNPNLVSLHTAPPTDLNVHLRNTTVQDTSNDNNNN